MHDAPSIPPPLAVDLDGTLVADDVSVKTILHLLRKNPFSIVPAVVWYLTGGRARLKHEIALRVPLDPGTLRYHSGVMDFLREERSRGRTLILATASDQIYADLIAAHVGLFDHAMGSDGKISLSSHRKRDALLARFGKYSYMGNSSADLEVWRGAEEAIAVATPEAVLKKLKTFKTPARIFS